MRIKITMEMSGNECLDLFRKIPKTVAQGLLLDLVVVNDGVENLKANSECSSRLPSN